MHHSHRHMGQNVHHHYFLCEAAESTHKPPQLYTQYWSYGGGMVLYLGCVEAHLQILRVKALNEDVLILQDSPYGDMFPIQVWNLHLDQIIDLISKDEINALTRKWQGWRVATLLANRSAMLKAENVESFDLNKCMWDCKKHYIGRNHSISDRPCARII